MMVVPSPPPAPSATDKALRAALTRYLKGGTCPTYLRVAATAWLKRK